MQHYISSADCRHAHDEALNEELATGSASNPGFVTFLILIVQFHNNMAPTLGGYYGVSGIDV